MTFGHLAVVASALLGWGDITVKPSKADRTHVSFQRSVAGLDKPSERTLETLKRYDVGGYRKDPQNGLITLEKIARENADPEVVYALAELSWIEGKRLDRWRKAEAVDRYLDAVSYSHDFLFDPDLAAGRNPSDPRYRLACDLYNAGLDRLLRAAQSNGQITPDGTNELKLQGRKQVLRVVMGKSAWKAADIDQVILASDFEVGGLETRSYQYGLGVPLIGIHRPDSRSKGEEKFYPAEMAFPLTAFLVPNSRLRDPIPGGKIEQPRECTLELKDPVVDHFVESDQVKLPIEADLTTPLAYMWSKTDLKTYRWSGLFNPGKELARANLMLLRPYERGKIPVVMVHGLISTPLAWIPMINELLNDPVIRDKYQFMLYMYPTGVPIPIAAAALRESLLKAQKTFDENGVDPEFNQMVLLGHSMGGLLSHAMAVRSGDKFWQLFSDVQFKKINGPPDVLAELQRYLFFEPLPFVKRVVFLATPHRGSDLSRNMIGRVGTSLISDPNQISELFSKLLKDNPDAFDRRSFRRMPTSIETLDTDHPMLLGLASMEPNPAVAFHSIIGAKYAGPVATTTDGVVTYRSSHFDGVESEVRVRSEHGVQLDPEAIIEVRRILRKHVGVGPMQTAVRPAPNRPKEGSPALLPIR